MARIAGRTRDETRERSLEAAVAAFSDRGYDGASLAHIAAGAGVTAATLCHHFGGKRGLYDAVTERIYRELAELRDGLDPELPLQELIERIYAHSERNAVGVRLMLRRIVDRDTDEGQLREIWMRPALDFTSQAVAAAYEVDPYRARLAIVALGHLIMRLVTNTAEMNCVAFDTADPAVARERALSLLVETAEQLLGRGAPGQARIARESSAEGRRAARSPAVSRVSRKAAAG